MANILLIVGHKVGSTEYIYNLKTAISMYEYLKQYKGINVSMDSADTEVQAEVMLVNKGNYDIVISIHYNAGGGNGFECFYYSTDANMLKLCKSIEKEVINEGQNSRGCKIGNQYMIINSVKPSSIILEGAFMDNKADWDNINLENMGRAYAKGLINYLGLKLEDENYLMFKGKKYKVVEV